MSHESTFGEACRAAWRRWAPGDPIRTIDAHAEGEPLRVILGGFPPLAGATQLERRRAAREQHDRLRTALMWEPRGHADMYGCLLTEPQPGGDFGVLFLHNEGYSTMCGHGIIAVTTVVLEIGLFPMQSPRTTLRIDTPAGRVTSVAHIDNGRVSHVTFRNVASFVLERDASVDVPGLGRVRYDIAFGGAFYAYVDAAPLGFSLVPAEASALIEAGRAIKRAVSEAGSLHHPDDPDLAFLYGTIFVGPAHAPDAHSRNVCIFADGEVDRSPTGTGVSGRLALHHARGELEPDETIVIESLLGTRFTGRVVEETRVGDLPAVIPEVGGRAFLTGRHEFYLDPSDPHAAGFLLR